MEGKFYQTPQGNLTILVMEHSILIWDRWGDNHWMVPNPESPRSNSVSLTGSISFDSKLTPDEILQAIDDAIAEKTMQE